MNKCPVLIPQRNVNKQYLLEINFYTLSPSISTNLKQGENFNE